MSFSTLVAFMCTGTPSALSLISSPWIMRKWPGSSTSLRNSIERLQANFVSRASGRAARFDPVVAEALAGTFRGPPRRRA